MSQCLPVSCFEKKVFFIRKMSIGKYWDIHHFAEPLPSSDNGHWININIQNYQKAYYLFELSIESSIERTPPMFLIVRSTTSSTFQHHHPPLPNDANIIIIILIIFGLFYFFCVLINSIKLPKI